MHFRYIVVDVKEGVATLTLNRPDVLNSFNRAMVREGIDAFERLAEDDAVRSILVTGAGRAFCAGQDLGEAVPPDGTPAPDIGDIVHGYNRLVLAMRGIEKPVVAAVNGVAAGAGANIALACDLVLAADSASFIQAFTKIGLIPDNGGTFHLPRLVGMARATALMMIGEKLSAEQALSWGLIYRVVPHAALADAAWALAHELAGQPTRAFGLVKRALSATWTNDLEAQLDLEAELQREAGRTHDYLEGVRAFQEKRKPSFLGR
jgi:2-(1,2-epoxy-1,2-dihydrophenyl)acetyl-CoA isomerase